MEIKFNCTGTERKRLAQAIGMIVGATPEYQFMPTCAYKIGQHTLDKDGTLHFTESRCYTDEVGELLKELEAQGFTVESLGEEHNELTITMPLDFFDETTFTNLDRLVENKGNLIKHALGADSLKYTVTDTAVEFPWFTIESEHDADAYSRFVTALCDMAKNQKRINNKPDTSDNKKYTFRCFLLRLGFIGAEYKTVRKVLLRKLTGSSAFRNGGMKMQFLNKQELAALREKYPKGTKIILHHMKDPYPVPEGTVGEVQYVDDGGNIHVHWSNGSTLAVIEGVDVFSKDSGGEK